jgi:hypothetical protein
MKSVVAITGKGANRGKFMKKRKEKEENRRPLLQTGLS